MECWKSGLWLTQGLDAEPLTVDELESIKDSFRFRFRRKMSCSTSLKLKESKGKERNKGTTVLPISEKRLNQNISVTEVRKYIADLLQQKKSEGENTVVLRAGDLQKELGLVHATPTVCDAMTKKINYEYDIIFAPPKGKSTKLTVKYYL